MKCTICGADNLEGAAYCEDCGSKLPTAVPPQADIPEEPMREETVTEPVEASSSEVQCPACGSENPGGSKFCDDCGASLEGAAATGADEDDEEEMEEPLDTPTGVAKLMVEGDGQEYLIDKDLITIGRQSPADGIFPDIDLTDVDKDAYISRRHAKIIRKDDGFIFEDVGSSNGSFINNVRIAPGVQQFLNEGDTIRLGKTVMHLVKG